MKLSFTTLDAFTTTPYAGNAVAIISVPASEKAALSQSQKQTIAREFNLSEVVFLHLPSPGASYEHINIDIFTSMAEVPFAGHPTIGASYYLLHQLGKDTKAVITKSGTIPIEIDSLTGLVKAVIPQAFHIHRKTFTSDLSDLHHPIVSIVKGMSFILAVLPDLETLTRASENLNGDTADNSPLDKGWQEGIVGTMYLVAQGIDRFGRKKYRTRMFAHREDPGTGSASSALGAWLALQEEEAGKGPFRYVFTQGIEMGKRNDISVEVTRDEAGTGIENILLSGPAVKVMEGTLEI
ncbi:putative isomerase [Hyphodiscus hymeniophilus]|uniref:Isomerase n=1 Tax=Hyphodiscus hymeniophilus TaxID=353542 RepID=A0A9P6VFZ3_9HELO|nr:putative isomerase [Hyphodiscus hymeniophilus]